MIVHDRTRLIDELPIKIPRMIPWYFYVTVRYNLDFARVLSNFAKRFWLADC